MLWTGLIMAALVAGTAAPQAATPPAAAPVAPPANSAADSRANALVCDNRPVTGSRLNQRRCRTRAQAAAARTQAQEYANQIQAGNASRPELVLDGGPR